MIFPITEREPVLQEKTEGKAAGRKERTGKIIKCKICNKDYYIFKSRIKRKKYCSRECREKKEIIKCEYCHTNFYVKRHRKTSAKFCSKKCVYNFFKKSFAGENNHLWKGDNVSYHGLHHWIVRKLGSPKKCEDCGTTEYDKKYEWANISKQYKRSNGLKDWKRLCRKCHVKFDGLYGENTSKSKLTKKEVLKIRNLYIPYIYGKIKLAKRFHVSNGSIQHILSRKNWAHI